MRQAVAPPDVYRLVGDVQHLDHDLVLRAGIVRIDDADPVGDHQSALEWRAASGENREAVAGRHLDDEAGPDEGDLARLDREVV